MQSKTSTKPRIYSVDPIDWFRNPIFLKDVNLRMQHLRTFLLITMYLGLLSVGVGIVLGMLIYSSNQPGSIQIWQRSGQLLFYALFLIELFLIIFISPALTAGSITSEREQQTMDLLQTSLLSSPRIIFGKLASVLTFLFLLIFISLPLYILAYLFGGISGVHIILGYVILITTSVLFSSVGILASTVFSRSIISTVVTYALVTIFVFGIPILILLTIAILIPILGLDSSTPSILTEVALFTIGWILASMNPISAAVLAEIGWLNNQSLLILNAPLSNDASYTLLSPWISYLFFSILSIVLYLLISIRFLDRSDI